jgi:hypothetical protein
MPAGTFESRREFDGTEFTSILGSQSSRFAHTQRFPLARCLVRAKTEMTSRSLGSDLDGKARPLFGLPYAAKASLRVSPSPAGIPHPLPGIRVARAGGDHLIFVDAGGAFKTCLVSTRETISPPSTVTRAIRDGYQYNLNRNHAESAHTGLPAPAFPLTGISSMARLDPPIRSPASPWPGSPDL